MAGTYDTFTNPRPVFNKDIPEGKTTWKSPSNIALVKYWGKRAVQLPMNPSVSFTLSSAVTTTTLRFKPATKTGEPSLTFYFENKRNLHFEDKTTAFFKTLIPHFPFLQQLDFEIHSENSFPHSAGIASSASSMSALALALCHIERSYFNTLQEETAFLQKASYVARLGSGSACRSVYGGVVLWGKTEHLQNSSDEYAVPVPSVHPLFNNYRDYILIVDAGEKKVSSRAGHSLMNNNPFAQVRFRQADQNTEILLKALREGALDTFIAVTESEALTLHAMMMTSTPSYLLMKPETVSLIEKIKQFRNETGIPVAFTLDAGPNIHLLFPEKFRQSVDEWINNQFKTFADSGSIIFDQIGKGPDKIE